jgi:hypothetical protein
VAIAEAPAVIPQTAPLPSGVAAIRMPCGLRVIFDEADRELVAAYRWHGKRKSTEASVYAQSTVVIDGLKTSLSLHRYLLGATRGDGQVLDHWNGDTLDNRRGNLRITDTRGNSMNIRSSAQRKRGGFKGVFWNANAGKWEAGICAGALRSNGKRKKIYLGLFEDPADAARAYDEAAAKHFGEFASPNFPVDAPPESPPKRDDRAGAVFASGGRP